MFDVMYLLLADQGFSLPPHPSSEEEEVFDVSSQKQKKTDKVYNSRYNFFQKQSIPFSSKLPGQTRKELLSLSLQIKFGCFSFFFFFLLSLVF